MESSIIGQKNITTTQRKLLNPDEILRIPFKNMIVILRGNKPCLIDKVMYTEHLLYKELKVISIVDYIPEWKKIKNSLANEQPNSNKKETEKLSFKTF